MTLVRTLVAAVLATGTLAATPASAQFFMASRDFSGAPMRGDEPGIGIEMPGATDAELNASLVWSLRAALNVAALSCEFEPTLLTVSNYNGLMRDHKDELAKSYDTLTKYFKRVTKTPKAAQTALDQFGTRVYSGFSTATAQYGFCQTASRVGRDVLFTPRGSLAEVASNRLRSLHNSLVPYGEQRFPRGMRFDRTITMPRFDAICWGKKNEWVVKKCGPDVQWVTRY
ncbi:MAG: hypothetical protein V4564_16475 [Pseudomonadota bacterium]|uniref:hypothetical protein n=1 Tax=Sphingomonas sp. ERG5 TaxID=1381597 RepID=UPI00054C539A|nr:hypothetical protein [Sphingomonas sp. ERG5]